jgi:hypothetical protein
MNCSVHVMLWWAGISPNMSLRDFRFQPYIWLFVLYYNQSQLLGTVEYNSEDTSQGLLWLPKSSSQKNHQVPVLKVRSQYRSQLKFTRSQFFRTETGYLHVPLPVSCINGPDLYVQMLMSVLYFCFSFQFHPQKQKDLQGSTLTFWPTCPFGQVPIYFTCPKL